MVAASHKNKNPCKKKNGINNTWYQYPFPQTVLYDKAVRLKIGLYGYDNLFKHSINSANYNILADKITHKLKKLTIDFYDRTDVLQIAKELLGKIIVTKFEGIITSGRIVETEAYIAIGDRASHSFGGRRTARNEAMFAPAGTSYVYICYGMHHLFNVVTNKKNVPDAVLIRAVEPMKGIDMMLLRTGKKKLDSTLTKGPGNVSKALGIDKQHSNITLQGKNIFIADDGFIVNDKITGTSKRIGVEGAGDSASLPYRFYIKGNKFVSGSPTR